LAEQYQRGLKGQAFDAPFDPDQETAWRDAWEEGRDERKRQHGKNSRTADRTAKRAATRKRVRARAKTSKRYYRKATKQLRNPVRQQLTSGSQVFVLSLAIVGLYLVLQTSDKVSGFIGGASRALQWFADPTASIPHKK
jgi:hypothetical protein